MATIKTSVLGDLAGKLIINDDTNDTPATNVTAATGSMVLIQIDATAGNPTTAEPACYVKVSDATGNISVGTTSPDSIFYAPIGQITTYVISGGWTFSNGLSFWAVTGGADNASTAPTSTIKVTIFAS